MLGTSHFTLGIGAGVALLSLHSVSPFEQPILFAGVIAVSAVASLLPDIDSREARIRTMFGVGSRQSKRQLWQRGQGIFSFLFNLIQRVIALILDLFARLIPHRGVTHWGLTGLLLALIVYLLSAARGWPLIYWHAFGVGYASHLVADGMTKAGIPLYEPFLDGNVHVWPRPLWFRTGSRTESVVVWLLLGLLAAWLFFY